jgi:hypothetical protein
MESLPEQRDADPSRRGLHADAAYSGLLARLDRDGTSAQVAGAERGGLEHLPEPVAETRPDEPITPELALVDPDLARRAREQLSEKELDHRRTAVDRGPAAQEPLFGFLQPTPSVHEADGRRRPRKRRRRQVLVLLILGAAAAVAVLRVEPLRHAFGESHDTASGLSPKNRSTAASPTRPAAKRKPRPPRAVGQAQGKSPTKQRTKPRRRAAPGPAQPPRAFAWVAVPNAAYYVVQFYRAGEEIFEATPSSPHLLVPMEWTFRGRRYRLSPGRYSWSVRPGYGRRSQARYGQPVVRAKLVIQRSVG